MSFETDKDAFAEDMSVVPPLLFPEDMDEEPDELSPMCPLSMCSGELKRCEFRCVVCPPYMFWRIAKRGVTVGGTVGTFSDY